MPSGRKDSSAPDQDASKPVDGKDASPVDQDAAADGGMDAGVDAYIPPPPPPPTRLLPHLSGGSVGRSISYRLYHSVGAPRVTGATVPQGMSSSANYRLNSGLSAATP
jgi:hypothetical protein